MAGPARDSRVGTCDLGVGNGWCCSVDTPPTPNDPSACVAPHHRGPGSGGWSRALCVRDRGNPGSISSSRSEARCPDCPRPRRNRRSSLLRFRTGPPRLAVLGHRRSGLCGRRSHPARDEPELARRRLVAVDSLPNPREWRRLVRHRGIDDCRERGDDGPAESAVDCSHFVIWIWRAYASFRTWVDALNRLLRVQALAT